MAMMISWVMPVNPSHPYLENDPAPSFAPTICAFHLGFSLVLQRRIIWRRDFWGEIELGDVVPQASYDSWLRVRQEASAGFFHKLSL